jgi:signal transduction histidine kinase
LAFIVANAERLGQALGKQDPTVVAARRALAVSRGAIADLAATAEPTLEAALRAVALEISSRYDVRVVVDAEHAWVSKEDRHELVRIVREAIVNAVQHGKARSVTVCLRGKRRGLVLRVIDDGGGIGDRVASQPHQGFGLTAMSERARAVGGSLAARRCPMRGTEIEVVV